MITRRLEAKVCFEGHNGPFRGISEHRAQGKRGFSIEIKFQHLNTTFGSPKGYLSVGRLNS